MTLPTELLELLALSPPGHVILDAEVRVLGYEAIEVVLAEWANETDLAARLDYYRTMEDEEGANKLMASVVLLEKWLAGDDIGEKTVENAVAEYWACPLPR
jgi:hypothetical protein